MKVAAGFPVGTEADAWGGGMCLHGLPEGPVSVSVLYVHMGRTARHGNM